MTCPNCGARVDDFLAECPNCRRLELAKGDPPSRIARLIVAVFLFATGFITTAAGIYGELDTFNRLYLGISIAVGLVLMTCVDTIWMRAWRFKFRSGEALSIRWVSKGRSAPETGGAGSMKVEEEMNK